jgi:LysM repeat protein
MKCAPPRSCRSLTRSLLLTVVLLGWGCPDLSGGTYVVRKGDTLTKIAQRHEVGLASLAEVNGMSLKDVIRPGEKLSIPDAKPLTGRAEPDRVVVVKRNDTLTLIARVNAVEVQDLANANGISLKDPIHPGQRLKVPSGPVAAPVPDLASTVQRAIDRAPVRKGGWDYIVVHHSATAMGSAKGMDDYHRTRRHMENGLAYHFVIGNGRGMKDGEVVVGTRWTRQLHGGHLKSERLNQVSIGICLVGDFSKTKPTRKQIDSLEALLESLMRRCNLKAGSIQTHKQIHPKHTECPGRRFDLNAVKRRLD